MWGRFLLAVFLLLLPAAGFVDAQVLFRNTATGDLAVWTLDGTERTAITPVDPSPVPDLNWRIVGAGDFNADGTRDIVWQEDTAGYLGVWLMDGPNRIRFEPFAPWQVSDLGWKIVAVADIDNDGGPDLIWREEQHGWVVAWLMDGPTRRDAVSVGPGTSDPLRRLAAAADFDGDGKTDLLWRHSLTGELLVWRMDGLTRLDVLFLDDAEPDTLWQVVGVADLNADGVLDLLWQHASGALSVWLMDGLRRSEALALTPASPGDSTWRVVAVLDRIQVRPRLSTAGLDVVLRQVDTGELAGWTMNGTERVAAGPIDPSPVDTTWTVVGVADFNADHHPDLVWQEQTRGDLGVWLMDGARRIRFEPFTPVAQVGDLGWKIVAVADLDNDGKPDLVWREESAGWLAAWLMDGTSRKAVVNLDPASADVQWTIAGAGDFSGDGRTDLVWHNPLTGQLHVWVMNGTSRTGMLTIDEGTDPALRVVATGDLNDDGRPDIVLQHQVTFALSAWLMSEGARTAVVELAAVEAGWRVQGLAPPRAGESITALIDRSVEREWGSAAAGSVLDVDSAARWRSEAVALPSAVVDGNRVLMYFAGVEATDNPYVSRVRVGLAVSEDGRAFHIANEGAPVFTEGPEGAFDSHSVSHPMVLRVDHEWWMYYAGADGTQGDDGVRVERLGLARSTDGITWTRLAEPVLDIGRAGAADSSQVASPFVLRIGGTFHLWYGAYGGTHRIAYATSADGVHWVKHGTVRGLRGAAAGELGPVVQFDGREFLMFYNSVDENHQWTLYAARSTDGQSWTAVNAGQPIVTNAPEGTFAEAGPNRNSAVHLSNLIPVGDDLLGYYTGEDLQSILRIGILRFVRR